MMWRWVRVEYGVAVAPYVAWRWILQWEDA